MRAQAQLRGVVKGSGSTLLRASEHVVPTSSRTANARSSTASDCIVEVTDLPHAVPGDTDDRAWSSKAKMLLQQSFKRFGPVLEVKLPTAVASVRFASSRGPDAVMVAAKSGFMKLGEGEVRVRLPGSSESVWQKFPPPRKPAFEKAAAAATAAAAEAETKKRRLRPNERFAPPPKARSAGADDEPMDESERFWEEQREKRQRGPEVPGDSGVPPPGPAASAPEEPPAPAAPVEPPRPVPAEAAPDASEEDLAVCKGEREVAAELAALLEKPFSQQRKELKGIRRRWHPDKRPDDKDVATRVFQFIQSHDAWLAFHGLA